MSCFLLLISLILLCILFTSLDIVFNHYFSVKPTDTRVGEWYLAEIPLMDPKFSLTIIINNIKINRLSSKPLTCYECNPDPTRIPDPLSTAPDPIQPVPSPIRLVLNQAKFDCDIYLPKNK